MSSTTFDLERFTEAQSHVYGDVLAELKAGDKQTHWMWFVFPQHRDLGGSAMAKKYGLTGLEEAREYWQHPLLGKRLAECTDLLLAVRNKSAYRILGSPDDLKLRSCMTIFQRAEPAEPRFEQVLERYFDGVPDGKTLEVLVQDASSR